MTLSSTAATVVSPGGKGATNDVLRGAGYVSGASKGSLNTLAQALDDVWRTAQTKLDELGEAIGMSSSPQPALATAGGSGGSGGNGRLGSAGSSAGTNRVSGSDRTSGTDRTSGSGETVLADALETVGDATEVKAESSILERLKIYMKKGERVENNIVYQIDEDTQIVFRKDVGEFAHRISSHGYMEPVDHYNIDLQQKNRKGRWVTQRKYHIVIDENGRVLDAF